MLNFNFYKKPVFTKEVLSVRVDDDDDKDLDYEDRPVGQDVTGIYFMLNKLSCHLEIQTLLMVI